MVLGGSRVPAPFPRHQERKDAHLLETRAVRVGSKTRPQTLAQLGELDPRGRIAARHLAKSLIGVEGQPGLFEDGPPTQPLTIDPGRLRLERVDASATSGWRGNSGKRSNSIVGSKND
jgi:hypothetical protein